MDCLQVLRRLSEIERAIGILDSISIRRMVIETQDYILQSQKKSIETVGLRDLQRAASESCFSLDRHAG
jgi:hypothetical protein